MDKNNVLTGIVVGMLVPVLGFFVVEFIFQMMMDFDIMDKVDAYTSEKRMRTMALIALCFNLIPLHIFKNKRWINSMRGITFPTLIYVGFWIYKFYNGLY